MGAIKTSFTVSLILVVSSMLIISKYTFCTLKCDTPPHYVLDNAYQASYQVWDGEPNCHRQRPGRKLLTKESGAGLELGVIKECI